MKTMKILSTNNFGGYLAEDMLGVKYNIISNILLSPGDYVIVVDLVAIKKTGQPTISTSYV